MRIRKDTVKYKLIPAAIHDFAHSFFSLMNYVDDEYLIDLMPGLLAQVPGGHVTIAFPSGRIEPAWAYPSVLVKSIGDWADALRDHLKSHRVSLDAIRGELRVAAIRDLRAPRGWRCSVEATDDRGRNYSIPVEHA